MVSSIEANSEVRELFGDFIEKVISSLRERGVNAGYTAISTPKDDMGIPTVMPVIARIKEGWKGRLPFNFKYDLSREGLLVRVYGHLHMATENDEAYRAVEQHAPKYVDAIFDLAKQNGLTPQRKGLLLERDLNLKGVSGLEEAFSY